MQKIIALILIATCDRVGRFIVHKEIDHFLLGQDLLPLYLRIFIILRQLEIGRCVRTDSAEDQLSRLAGKSRAKNETVAAAVYERIGRLSVTGQVTDDLNEVAVRLREEVH